MNGLIKTLSSDSILRMANGLALMALLLLAVLIFLFYTKLPPYIPLFNQLPWGDTRLGTQYQILLPICITVVILLVNIFFSHTLYAKMPLVSRMISFTSFLVSILMLIFTIRILLLIL